MKASFLRVEYAGKRRWYNIETLGAFCGHVFSVADCWTVENRPMHLSILVYDRKFGQTWIRAKEALQMRKRSCQDKAIRGSSFVPSYF